MATAPAIVSGDEMRATAYFIEESNGDLVDIEYECVDCEDSPCDALPWPAFDFGDSGAYCRECGAIIQTATVYA